VEKQAVIKVYGEEVELRAQVAILNGYSAHADRTELAMWLDAVKKTSPNLQEVFLVHGEVPAQDAFAERLTLSGYHVQIPTPGMRFDLT
jgi:metallo-beta-lactamase family protein